MERRHIERLAAGWLVRHSVPLLRVSMGLVFLGFGVLKFFPGLSPAEELAQATVVQLTFGLVPEDVGIVLVAAMESAIGLSLLTGRFLRAGLALLGVAAVGILSPLVLFPDELFVRNMGVLPYAPTLAAQYVFKDLVLLAATLVLAANVLGGRSSAGASGARPPVG
jgi:putative oxidoreductase